MLYRWRGLRFECPEGRDDSTILIVDSAVPAKWNLSVRVDQLPAGPGALATYAAALGPPSGASLSRKSSRAVAGREAVVVEYELKLQDGTSLKQQQALVPEGQQVHIFTMSATAAGDAAARAALDKLLETLTWEKP